MLFSPGKEVLSIATPAPDSPQNLFNKGNFLIEEQNFSEAVAIFQEIQSAGYHSGPLYLNMAVSYVHLDSLGKSLCYFKKGAGFRETAAMAQRGILFIEEQVQLRGALLPRLPWYLFIDHLLFGLKPAFWISLSLILLNGGALVLFAGWWKNTPRWIRLSGGSIAGAGLLLLLFYISTYAFSLNYQQGVVIDREVVLLNEPPLTHLTEEEKRMKKERDPDIALEAYRITLDKRKSKEEVGHFYIRLQNGVTGWVPESSLCLY